MADAAGHKCATAPGVVFPSRAELKEHYGSDWHRYNLKRKVARLPPVRYEEFSSRRDSALAQASAIKSKKQNHLKDKSGKGKGKGGTAGATAAGATAAGAADAAATSSSPAAAAAAAAAAGGAGADETKEGGDAAPAAAATTTTTAAAAAAQDEAVTLRTIFAGMTSGLSQDDLEGDKVDWAALQARYEEEQAKFDPRGCIFDAHVSETVEENLKHMHRKYGFFVPDMEYVCDIEGLIKFVAAKVKLGCVCLQCGKSFKTGHATQKHMIDTFHCKLKYDVDDDLDELGDYYDFSASYAGMDEAAIKAAVGEAAEEEGWETCSDDDDEEEEGGEGEGEGEVGEEVAEGGGGAGAKKTTAAAAMAPDARRLALTKAFKAGRRIHKDADTEELVLLDGRRVGHREYRRYFKQRYRPDEFNEARLAETKELTKRMEIMYKDLGVDTSSALVKQKATMHPRDMSKKWKKQMWRDQMRRDRKHLDHGMRNFWMNPNPLKPNDSGYVT